MNRAHTAQALRSLLLPVTVGMTVTGSMAQGPADSAGIALRDVQVRGHRVRSYLQDSAGVQVMSMEMMAEMPKILGNADPMRYAQLMPGIQSNSEFDAGLHIQGCDNSHNMVSIEGVPLYNVAHLLGFFSIFNPSHYSTMSMEKSPRHAFAPNRIGGVLSMNHADTLARRTSGEIAIGPMSSQGTLRLPAGCKSQFTVSARAAYLNLLYSRWLKIDGQQMRYFFSDYNLTYRYQPDRRNTVWADAYIGNDRGSYKEADYGLSTRMDWGNAMGAVHWCHRSSQGWKAEQCVYVTHYANRLKMEQATFALSLPSDVTTVGYRGRLALSRMTLGMEYGWHSLQPQSPETDRQRNSTSYNEPRQHAHELSVSADHTLGLTTRLALESGLRASVFRTCGQRTFASADPTLSLVWTAGRQTRLTLNGLVRHQYLLRTGFSSVGLPTEFMMAADKRYAPQWVTGASLTFDTYLWDRSLRVSAEVYYKRLANQVEYVGNAFDFIFSDYSLDKAQISGSGHNYGLCLMAERRKGRLTGWLSYTYSRARRHFSGTRLAGSYPADHERPHELNMVGTYRLDRHWSFGGTLVVASGTPYTRIKRFYLISSNIVTEYGPHNGERLNPYLRLDLSANYDFCARNGKRRGINFSLYNATMHSNDIFRRLKVYKNGFAYKPYRFILPVLPSVSYYQNF